jgi:hypothetical protein
VFFTWLDFKEVVENEECNTLRTKLSAAMFALGHGVIGLEKPVDAPRNFIADDAYHFASKLITENNELYAEIERLKDLLPPPQTPYRNQS